MGRTIIDIDDISVEYRIFCGLSIKHDLFKRRKKEKNYYKALSDISFQVHEGEVIGIVGKNGSGKSTLLKTIAGVFSPNSGCMRIEGSVSLLSLGLGFKENLSGLDNIMLSGLLMGFSEEEIKMKIDEIVEFSELGEFIYLPVMTYSSGMYTKLAFSITAFLSTDIILIDEVLSVGDERFQRKSFKKISSIIKEPKRSVMIISHDLDTLATLCDKILWLHEGKIKKYGNTEQILNEYGLYMREGIGMD